MKPCLKSFDHDGKEEFGKNYVLLVPVNAEEDEDGQVENSSLLIHRKRRWNRRRIATNPRKTSEDEWNMIEEVLQ